MNWWKRWQEKTKPAPQPERADAVRWHLFFYGRVQGVGFRYQATCIARELNVTGWVRNCSDGTVEMEAQGSPEELAQLVAELRSQRYIRVERVERETVPVKRGDRPFYPAN